MARALTTRLINAAYFTGDWGDLVGGRLSTSCQRRLGQLREWKLITISTVAPTFARITGTWSEEAPLAGPLTPWGRAVTIAHRGILALVDLGVLPAERENHQGEIVRGWEQSWQIRPRTSSYGHTFLVAAAALRAIHANRPEYRWVACRDLRGLVDRSSGVIPDGLIQTERVSWVLEGDKGSITPNTLLDRWRRQVPVWDQAHQQGLRLPAQYRSAPLGGLLWYCAHSSPTALRNRVWRLREEAVGRIAFPPTLGWYVDSFDGLSWTYRHYLGPWAEGRAPHPQDLLLGKVQEYLQGQIPEGLTVVAALGNLSAWQRVIHWIAEAKLTLRHPPIVVLVRDGTEALQLWKLAHDAAGAVVRRMGFVIARPSHPTDLHLDDLQWRPGETWQRISLHDLLSGHSHDRWRSS